MCQDIKAVLIDFDGTLIDLPTDYDAIRKELNVQITEYGAIPKPSITDTILQLGFLRALKFETSIREEQKNVYQLLDKWEIQAVKHSKVMKGAWEFIHHIKTWEQKVVIISRNCREAILLALTYHRFPLIDLIFSRNDVENIKPHPDHALSAIEHLKITPSECIIIGDSWHDRQLGRELGIRTYPPKFLDLLDMGE